MIIYEEFFFARAREGRLNDFFLSFMIIILVQIFIYSEIEQKSFYAFEILWTDEEKNYALVNLNFWEKSLFMRFVQGNKNSNAHRPRKLREQILTPNFATFERFPLTRNFFKKIFY